MKNLSIITVVVLFLSFVSCKKDDKTETYSTAEDITLLDVSYGTHSQQRMDIYLPAGRDKAITKFIVMIHGGGWIGGDKSDFGLNEDAIKVLKEQFPGFALFNLNYRLATANSNQYPTAEQDIQSAMAYIYDNLESYQVSSNNYLLGGSAGAHLAALYALKKNDNRVQGCIAISGPYDLVDLYNEGIDEAKSILQLFMGGTPTQQTDAYRQASPINFVHNASPKFLLLHGKEDQLVPVSQAEEFKSALLSKNITTNDFFYSGGHGIPPEHLVEAFVYLKAFIK